MYIGATSGSSYSGPLHVYSGAKNVTGLVAAAGQQPGSAMLAAGLLRNLDGKKTAAGIPKTEYCRGLKHYHDYGPHMSYGPYHG